MYDDDSRTLLMISRDWRVLRRGGEQVTTGR